MRREEMADLTAFMTVAEERSFTRAAAKLGMSQSALSQLVRRLEARLGLRLLARTTRSVAPTAAGERILATLAPALHELEASIAELGALREKPAGTIRITSVEHATRTILAPALARLLPDYPDIRVEVIDDYALADIVADRFDAGVRLGDQVAKDMIAVPLGPPVPMAIAGSPGYFAAHGRPDAPQRLIDHRCINLRLPTSESLYPWNFVRGERTVKVRVDGPLTFNALAPIRMAALDGLGLAYIPLDEIAGDLAAGALVRVLDRWTPPLPPYHLYYPARRQAPAFRLLVDALRYRG